MSNMQNSSGATFQVCPIGTIHRPETGYYLQIDPPYRPGLKQLKHFSHITVLWWATEQDTPDKRREITCYPPYAPEKETGIFATRAEYRPNPICTTVCQITEINEEAGIVKVQNIDAFENTPLLDIKGYFPVCDRVNGATIPAWLDWGVDHLPDEGMGLFEEYEEVEAI